MVIGSTEIPRHDATFNERLANWCKKVPNQRLIVVVEINLCFMTWKSPLIWFRGSEVTW